MSALANVIVREIQRKGPMPFARFMDLALYCPDLGFYERFPNRIGRCGDFFTAVSAGSVLGELLAAQFATWFSHPEQARFQPRIVEAGAHSGQLALDILTALGKHCPSPPPNLEYWIVETSPRRQQWQQQTLHPWARSVRWFPNWNAIPERSCHGVILANELLDAMPVHQFRWDTQTGDWREWGIGLDRNHLTWTPLHADPSSASQPEDHRAQERIPHWPTDLLQQLPDGYAIEVCPAAADWWRQASRRLQSGYLLTLDYGLLESEWLNPRRTEGTLRAYANHQLQGDVLANPGEQDLTTHINLSAIQRVGEEEGLTTHELCSQGVFLSRVLRDCLDPDRVAQEWTPSKRRQFQTLTHPEIMGNTHRVLIQSRP